MEAIGQGVEALAKAFWVVLVVAILSVPLALWKAVEIAIWVAHHLRWAG